MKLAAEIFVVWLTIGLFITPTVGNYLKHNRRRYPRIIPMSKETSETLAAIAGRILHQGRVIDDLEQYNTDALSLAGSVLSQREIPSHTSIVQAQVDGAPLPTLELTTDQIVKDPESNFQFYVDGYTMTSTDVVGQIHVTAPDGRTAVIKSQALTDFIERRLPDAEAG